LYAGRRNALDEIIADMLVTQAAKAKNMTPEAYVEAEVAKRAKKVSESDVVAFYQSNVGQMQGRSLEQMSPAITRFLEQQEESTAKQALVTELKKAGPAVPIVLEAPGHAGALDP